MTDAMHSFWTDSRRWPVEMPGYVFLANAVNQIGKVRYPQSWTGDEPWTALVYPLPEEQHQAQPGQLKAAYELLGLKPEVVDLPALSSPITSRNTERPSVMKPLDENQWIEARLISLKRSVASAEKSARWQDVKSLTEKLFRIGGLRCYVRPREGGAYDGPLKPEVWNTENTDGRFGQCLMDLGNLYRQTDYAPHTNIRSPSYSRQNFQWIFIDEASLETAIEAIGKLPPPHPLVADKVTEVNGPGRREYDDAEAVEAMHLLVTNSQMSAWAAAEMVAEKTQGNSKSSTQTRLHGKFKKKYPELVAPRAARGA